ncbi:hypothetical protein B0H21DRAFT_694894 [Amylocystis lapponica]|nr:hypothetical protein B0H21DRAFT_694894 [Amylocystis lapponica]
MPVSPGNPMLRETRRMTEEPRPISRTTTSLLIPRHTYGAGQRDEPKSAPPDLSSARKWTQEDQDEHDAEARKKAMKDLIQSWQDRLQLISVITTFFAAVEGQLLGVATPDPRTFNESSRIVQTATAALTGALVVHLFAGKYKLEEAKREEQKVEAGFTPVSSESHTHTVWSTNPHLAQVGPFRRGHPPTTLLDHCHTLCMVLSAIGFLLALAGVLCYTWARLPRSVSIFATVCMGVCWIGSLCAIFAAAWA